MDEQYLRQGRKVEITYPNVAFITVVATSIPLPGVFRIGYKFEAKEAPILEEQAEIEDTVDKSEED